MTEAQAFWLVTTVLASFAVNIAAFKLSLEDRLPHPARWSIALNLIILLFVGGLILSLLGPLPAAIIAAVSLVFLNLNILFFLSRKDRKGINWGQEFIPSSHVIDLQINFLLSLVIEGATTTTLRNAIDDTLYHILDEITRVVPLSQKDDASQVALLLCLPEGGFSVLCQRGIPAHRIAAMDAQLRHLPHPVGVAGQCANTRSTIYIPDLSDESDQNVKHWIRLDKDEDKSGSLYCEPIKKGVGSLSGEALAVLSLTSKHTHKFDTKIVPNYINMIAPKIECVLYIRALHA